jgi:hypothetical protein
MNETKVKLASIDDGDFENLVIFYLRQKYPHLKGLIQTGINENGEAIKCKVDGILYVHETDEAVSVAITVTELNDLTRKWLGGKKGKNNYEKGDIVKAGEEFAEWRKTNTASKLKLFLAVNKFIENDTGLYKDAITKGKSAGLEVEIIEASILIPFLDFDAEGQFIRQDILKIDAGRLSENLLRKIASQSLETHKTRFFIGNSNCEIKRTIEDDIFSALKSEQTFLIGVQAASGLGKSTVVRSIGEAINKNGGICIWCPAEEININHNLVGLFQDILKIFIPSLNSQAGDNALEIARNSPENFVLIVDDINRTSTPSQILDTLKILASQAKSNGLNLKFLVPLWNNQFYSQDLSEGKSGEWKIINLQTYSDDEKSQLLNSVNSSQSTKFNSLIESLNGDPFLCGLARESVSNDLFFADNNTPENINIIVDKAIQKALRDSAEKDGDITQGELKKSLDSLIELIIHSDNPEPRWLEIKDSVREENTKLLLKITKINQLFGLDSNASTETLRWRHERLRDSVIGKWLAENILSENSQSEKEYLFSIPGLAEAFALAVIFTPLEGRKDALIKVAQHQPLALAELLRINALNEDLNKIIVEQLKNHLSGWDMKHDFSLDPKWQILDRLRQTDNQGVLEITKVLPQNWGVSLASFRNGEVESGLRLMKEFHPESHFRQLEQVIEIFKQKNQEKKSQVAYELLTLSKNKNLIYKIFTLIGYLGWKELAQTTSEIWETLPEDEKLQLLVYFVWALNRCGDSVSQKFLKEALLLTKKISDEDKVEGNVHHGSDRYEKFIEPIRHTLRWGITDESVKTWISVIEKNKDLKNYAYFLGLIDNSISLETYIKLRAKGDFTPFDIGEFSEDDHGENSKANSFQSSKLPTNPETRNHLWQIIISETDDKVREWAFRFWRRSATSADLKKLQTVSEEDFLYDEVLRLRVLLRDKNAIEKLVKKINNSPEKWCGYSYPLCSDDNVLEALVNNIEKAYEDIFHKSKIETLPNLLPAKAVRKLIKVKSDWLKSKPRMWTALWGADISESLEFVQNCIRDAKPEDLKYFFLISGKYYPLTQKMLDAITPVFNCFTERDRGMFAFQASSNGFPKWADKVFSDASEEYESEKWTAKKRWLTKDDALATLNELSEKASNGINEVEKSQGFYQLDRNREICFDLRELLKFWVNEKNEPNRINIAAMLLKSVGEGDDSEWWSKVMPAKNMSTFKNWRDTLYLLRRRRWQKSS